MPPHAGPKLRKVTLNLYEADCKLLERHYGRGWTTVARDILSDHAKHIRRSTPTQTKTLGDLDGRD